jgi:hypothetical protein
MEHEVNRLPEGEQRASTRFPIEEDIYYKVYGEDHSVETGTGKTLNISSRGVLFSTERMLVPGRRIEIAVNWPVQLENSCPLKFVASGQIVRSRPGQAAVRIERYEFRTRGAGLKSRPVDS